MPVGGVGHSGGTPRVGVRPPSALHERPLLFAALESACHVRFRPAPAAGGDALDGVIEFTESATVAADANLIPRLVVSSATDGAGEAHGGRRAHLEVHLERSLGAVLGDATLPEAASGRAVGFSPTFRHVLATCSGRVVWDCTNLDGSGVTRVGLAPAELDQGEQLINRLTPGRFLGLLPWLRWLRSLGGSDWRPPPLRAAFVFDDPSLHFPRYGHLDFAQLAERACEVGFHVAIATVPLDGRFTHPRAVRVFREHPRVLSLLIHGNDHVKHELERANTADTSRRLLALALRRVAGFERHTGLSVARVMAAPHGRCSRASAVAMRQLRYDALILSRPRPWTSRHFTALEGWYPAEMHEACVPIIPRRPLATTGAAELRLRAFLHQPLVLYGHHGDVADGYAQLESLATLLNSFGVNWVSMREMATTNVSTKVVGDRMHVRPHGLHVRVLVPPGVTSLQVAPPAAWMNSSSAAVGWDDGARMLQSTSEPIGVRPGQRIDMRLLVGDEVDALDVPSPRRSRWWPVARRALTELRDQVEGVVQR